MERTDKSPNPQDIPAPQYTLEKQKEISLTGEAFIALLESRDVSFEIEPPSVTIPPGLQGTLEEILTYHYDFKRVDEAHQRISHLNTRETLQLLFQHITQNIPEESHELKWLEVSDFLSRTLRHPSLFQPMYPDKTIVTHPLVLLYLGEARCGHVARVVVDLALANGYEARLVQLAAHVVAEVKWNGSWHFIDANADFPLQDIKRVFANGIPSLRELANEPYTIDKLAVRSEEPDTRDSRTTKLFEISRGTRGPPATITMSSAYFSEQLFRDLYSESPSPRLGLQYWYKNGNYKQWENDKYYGWNDLSLEVDTVPMIPIEFKPPRIRILAPLVTYKEDINTSITIYFLKPKRICVKGDDVFNPVPIDERKEYEIRVSSQARGWAYDFRNYNYMPSYGKGDIQVVTLTDEYGSDLVQTELNLGDLKGVFFVEVIPRYRDLVERESFIWPSYETAMSIR